VLIIFLVNVSVILVDMAMCVRKQCNYVFRKALTITALTAIDWQSEESFV